MATEASFFDNLPVKFNNESDSCLECDTRSFCQLAEWSDRFEFAYTPGSTDVSITNGTFAGSLAGWTTADWTYSSGKARIVNSVDSIYQTLATFAGRQYKITFTISNYSGTSGLRVYLGGSYHSDIFTANGTYTIYIVPSSSSELAFSGFAATFTLDLDNVSVELMNDDCGILLYNTENETYTSTPLFANITNSKIPYLGYSYLWSDFEAYLPEGCYKIALYGDANNGNELITNGTFTGSATGWTLDALGWVYSTNEIHLANNKSNKNFYQTINTVIGKKYTVYFLITQMSSLSTLLVQAHGVTIGTITGMTIGLGTETTFSYTFIATGATTVINFKGTTPSPSVTVILDNVSVVDECDQVGLSECFKIATTHNCTKILKWTNGAVNGFNYPYYYFYNGSTHGYHRMRVESDLRNSKYPGQEEKYIDSGGSNKLYYSSSRKQKELVIAAMPEYMHDALSIGLLHKEFYIDDERYTFEDSDYMPEWSSVIHIILAQVKILVAKFTQNLKQID